MRLLILIMMLEKLLGWFTALATALSVSKQEIQQSQSTNG